MSTFDEVLAQVIELLQREGRVAYRVLKRRFTLDDEYIEDLKADLIDAKRLAVDEDGKVLVWIGASPISSSTLQVSGSYLSYLPDVRDTAKSGMGRTGNRHLPYLAESISVNVGGSRQHGKVSSLPRTVESVGGVIVLGAQENCVQGEGR